VKKNRLQLEKKKSKKVEENFHDEVKDFSQEKYYLLFPFSFPVLTDCL
jgi:hypothetical protein